jgi:hypothetical protein
LLTESVDAATDPIAEIVPVDVPAAPEIAKLP